MPQLTKKTEPKCQTEPEVTPNTGVVNNTPSHPNKDNEMKDHIKGLFHDMASNLNTLLNMAWTWQT